MKYADDSKPDAEAYMTPPIGILSIARLPVR